MFWQIIILTSLLSLAVISAQAALSVPEGLKPPVQDDIWLRPAAEGPAEPTIGFKDGIRIGLWPTRGPRGLIRIFAPYAFPENNKRTLINFIAIEPVVSGQRGYSELEHSKLDNVQGKRFWFADDLKKPAEASLPWNGARGKTGKIWEDGKQVRTLSVVVDTEPLDNGAKPRILITFREDRPNEISLKTYAADGSAQMESCILTATMGNYSRTRLLWLKDEVLDSRKIWPTYKGDGFVGTDDIPMERLMRGKDGTITAAITPNEKDLASVKMPWGGWHCNALISTQYWRKYPKTAQKDLRVRVNGRAMYWAGHTLIPGGVAFENFEMIETYKPGGEFCFGVTLKTPKELVGEN